MMEPLTLSWTRLSTWEECRHKAYRQSQGKRSPVTDGRVFLPGTLTDRAQRSWLEEDDPQPGGMHKYVESLMEEHTGPEAQYRIKWRGPEDRRNVLEMVHEAIDKLEPALTQLVLPHEYQPEVKFSTQIGIPDLYGDVTAVTLIGGMDILVRDGDGFFHLYDLKTTRDDSYVRGKTLGQLTFYALAVEAWLGLPPGSLKTASFLTPLCKERVVPVYITESERTVMMSRIVSYAHGAWQEQWQPVEGTGPCGFCDVKHACDKFNIPAVRDAQGRARISFEAAAARRRNGRAGGAAGVNEASD